MRSGRARVVAPRAIRVSQPRARRAGLLVSGVMCAARLIQPMDRESLNTLGSFGSSGSEPGQFKTPVHDLTMDSQGSIYTGEAATAGRVQKFRLKE